VPGGFATTFRGLSPFPEPTNGFSIQAAASALLKARLDSHRPWAPFQKPAGAAAPNASWRFLPESLQQAIHFGLRRFCATKRKVSGMAKSLKAWRLRFQRPPAEDLPDAPGFRRGSRDTFSEHSPGKRRRYWMPAAAVYGGRCSRIGPFFPTARKTKTVCDPSRKGWRSRIGPGVASRIGCEFRSWPGRWE